MRVKRFKMPVDILAMFSTLAVIVTGFVLHKEVHHLHIYNDTLMWGWHETFGLLLMALIAMHCVQHSPWFKHYRVIPANRKRVTTIFLIVAAATLVTGVILMSGSQSELVSHIHYAMGILFTIIAIGHVVKRWKIFRSLI